MDNNKTISANELSNNNPSYLETIFSIANGHFGVRASNPVEKSVTGGTIVNGFYETSAITYGEKAYGYAENNQTIVKLPDFRTITICDDSKNEFSKSELKDESLNMDNGVVKSVYKLSNKDNQSIELTLEIALQQLNNQVVGLRYEIKSIDYVGKITVVKHLDIVNESEVTDDPRKSRTVNTLNYDKAQLSDSCEKLKVTTEVSKLFLNLALCAKGSLEQSYDLGKSDSITLDYVGFVSDIGEDLNLEDTPSFDDIVKESSEFWQRFWKSSEVKISGDDKLNQAIHYNLFQLTSSTGRDGRTNIPAKGLSGTGYEGHYFWDTEMYMSPFFAYTNPKIAQELIKYRHSILDASKKRARQLGVKEGALYAWRTINGEEASAYYPAGTAQYHIDADISYAINRYYDVTGDSDFIEKYGLEVIIETARFWKNFGSYSNVAGEKKFCFFDVTGPDEYTAIVNNNYYTNRMAKFNLEFAVKLIDEFPVKSEDFGVTKKERDEFAKIASDIYLPYDKKLGINMQDDSAFEKPIWPFADTPKENYPLLLHYHPLAIYRYQVNKQADTLLADFLFDDISKNQLTREYDYYEKITTHDSSLSRSIFSALAARIGLKKKAYSYFTDTVRTDLTDLQGNTDDGLHVANLGGSWLTVVAGFGGIQVKDDTLEITNNLPDEWNELSVRIMFRGRLLEITYSAKETNVKVIEGKPLEININGAKQLVK